MGRTKISRRLLRAAPGPGDQTQRVVQPVRVSKIHLVDARDAFHGDVANPHRLAKTHHGQDGDLVARVVAFDVEGGVRFGVSFFLGLGQDFGERTAAPLHLRQDVIGGAVQDAIDGGKVLARQPFTHRVQHRRSARDASFDSQTHMVRAAALHQLHAVFSHQLLVGRHQMLARLQRRKGDGASGGQNPHQLHDDVDFRIADDLFPVGSDLDGLAQPGEIPLVHAAGTDDLELKIASQPPLDFALVLGQNLQRARADGPQPDHSQAQATLPGVADSAKRIRGEGFIGAILSGMENPIHFAMKRVKMASKTTCKRQAIRKA